LDWDKQNYGSSSKQLTSQDLNEIFHNLNDEVQPEQS